MEVDTHFKPYNNRYYYIFVIDYFVYHWKTRGYPDVIVSQLKKKIKLSFQHHGNYLDLCSTFMYVSFNGDTKCLQKFMS